GGEGRPARGGPRRVAGPRRDDGRGGGQHPLERQEPAQRGTQAGRGVAAAGSGRARGRRLRGTRGSRHAAPQVMSEKTYLQAISDGLREEMRRDRRVFLIGDDVGVYGGAFKVSLGFQEEFGPW